jgi:hypothetical protein
MPKRARKKTQWPRMTILSMNRCELVSFVNAVEVLHHLVEQLVLIAERLDVKVPRKRTDPNSKTASVN